MYQREIEFFWPLTEQVRLDLDYTPCEEYNKRKQEELAKTSITSGQFLIAGGGITGATWATIDTNNVFSFKPDPDSVGCWELNKDLQVWRKDRPNKIHQKMTKFFFGWEWKDK